LWFHHSLNIKQVVVMFENIISCMCAQLAVPPGEGCLSKRDRRQLVDARCREALASGQRVCVDLSMEHLMSNKVGLVVTLKSSLYFNVVT